MKTIEILLIVILILATILGIKIYNNNKKPEYTLRDIQLILKKADQLTNYECEINYGLYKNYKRKDSKMVLKQSDSDSVLYKDYDKQLQVVCKPADGKNYYIEKDLQETAIPSSNLYTSGFTPDELVTLEIELLSVKEEKFKEKNCLKVELNDKEDREMILWIDMYSGLVMKLQSNEGEVFEIVYKFDTVKEEDVTPDLTGYTKIEADS